MASKKKVVRCNCCGVKAAAYIGGKTIEELAVCENIVCSVTTLNEVKQAIENNKEVEVK
jgi:hypothetical protein